MSISTKWQVKVNRNLPPNLRREIGRRVLATGELVRGHIVQHLAGQRNGRLYRVPGTKVWYRASAPGEYPAVRTGAMRQSIRMIVIAWNRVTVGSDVGYARALELRPPTAGGRPWLSRAASETRNRVAAIWLAPWILS